MDKEGTIIFIVATILAVIAFNVDSDWIGVTLGLISGYSFRSSFCD